jgi:hypothetical protein
MDKYDYAYDADNEYDVNDDENNYGKNNDSYEKDFKKG